MDTKNQALLDYMIEKLGGEDAVMMEFREKEICDAAASGKTLGELFDAAAADGWLDHFKRLKVSGLVKIVERNRDGSKPRQVAAAASTRSKPQRRPRMSSEEKTALHASILEHLKQNPWTGVGEISRAVGFDSRLLGSHLRQMRKDGLLESKGSARATTYASK